MRQISSLSDVQIVLNQLLSWQSLWDTKARDQKGLQIKNAGEGTAPDDFVTLSQLSGAISSLSTTLTNLQNTFSSLQSRVTKLERTP